jgi:hypothetical protein
VPVWVHIFPNSAPVLKEPKGLGPKTGKLLISVHGVVENVPHISCIRNSTKIHSRRKTKRIPKQLTFGNTGDLCKTLGYEGFPTYQ